MNDQKKEREVQMQNGQIDLYQLLADLWKNLRRHLGLAALCMVLGAVGFCAFQFLYQTPMYETGIKQWGQLGAILGGVRFP